MSAEIDESLCLRFCYEFFVKVRISRDEYDIHQGAVFRCYRTAVKGAVVDKAVAVSYTHLNTKKADYIVTGQWAKKAAQEAQKFGDIRIAATSEPDVYTYIPKLKREDFRQDADYVYITTNNTIYGSRYNYIPDTGDVILAADQSSNFLSEVYNVSDFGLIFACLLYTSTEHRM